MALPLLPAKPIQPAFNNLRDSLPDEVNEHVTALVTYVMYREAQYVTLQAVLVSEYCLHRHQKKAHKQTQGLLSKYWASYAAGEITTVQLLRNVATYTRGVCRAD